MKESVKLPVVLSINLFLIFIQTAGAFYSKSLALFSFAGVIIVSVFSLLIKLAALNNEYEDFRKALFTSIILNILTLFILALIIIVKAFIEMASPKIINVQIAEITTVITFIGFIICSFIYKRFILISLLPPMIIAGFAIPVFRKITFLNYYLSIFFAVLIIIKAVLLIKNSVYYLKK
jgi:Co/Zn/Cd efflux system component